MPTTETGTATSGMIDARHVCRNRITTSTTSTTASISVCCTARIDSRTNTVGSHTGRYATPGGKRFDSSSNFAYTAFATSSAFAPGDRKMPTTADGLSLKYERSV